MAARSNKYKKLHAPGLFDAVPAAMPAHPSLLIHTEDSSEKGPVEQGSITYGHAYTKFGSLLMASTEHGICRAEFGITEDVFLSRLSASFSGSSCVSGWVPVFDDVLRCFSNEPVVNVVTIPVHLRGTAFQLTVWKVLAGIPFGTRLTYSEVAALAGRPDAVRAVGTAIGRNPVSWLVPCHRVVHTDGRIGQYMWGADRKRELLAWEMGLTGT